MFALVVRFDLPDESAARAFDEATAEVLPGITSEEPGTLLYLTHRVEGEPLARVFYEAYADRAAHTAHSERPGTAAFLARVGELVSGTRVELLEPGEHGKGRPSSTVLL